MRLHELKKGGQARVTKISSVDAELEAKLREIGFAEDDEVEIVHFGPIGGKPICARLNQTLIALRIEEAAAIKVEVLS
ncbi:MAG: FeoA family protein [Pseudomonadota bacterium]